MIYYKISLMALVYFVCLLSSSCKKHKEVSRGIDDYERSHAFFRNWSQIKIGMTSDQVIDLLGEPDRTYKDSNGVFPGSLRYYSNAGYSPSILDSYTRNGIVYKKVSSFYSLSFENNKLFLKKDPWGGRSMKGDSNQSEDLSVFIMPVGVATKPDLLIPNDSMILNNYPRYVDFRWMPSSGRYPITYFMELERKNRHGEWRTSIKKESQNTIISITGGSKGKYRWKVKAQNKDGESKWSEYRYFEFTR